MATVPMNQSFDTPNIPASTAVVISHSTTRIAAPASTVFRTLRNTETWKDWSKWVAKCNITYQPPDEDLTAAEINELVRNTSIAGCMDSDLTDGMAGGGTHRKPSHEEVDSLPPLKLRKASTASGMSNRSGSDAAVDGIISTTANPTAPVVHNNNNNSNNTPHLSGAQKFAAAQEERRSSIASGRGTPAIHNTLTSDPTTNSSRRTSSIPNKSASTVSAASSAAAKAKTASLIQMYGEPSVRIQLNTKMTLSMRMNPGLPQDSKPIHLVVTEVSRPDDPVTEGNNLTALTRSKTHTLSRQAIYRIVWTIDSSLSSLSTITNGSSFPKSLLMAERVHEIRPIYLGDGSEECEYRTWECQRGPLAKVVKKRYAGFLQQQFELWGKGLGAFCEALGGKVDRRDFIFEHEDIGW